MSLVINAQDLYKCYPGFPPVLRGTNIDVSAGEMIAIMGPSGCGKSTMLHILGMLHAPDSGTLNILNTDILSLSNEEISNFRRENMGFVMQSSNLFDHSTVFENVEFPLIYERVPPEERWERVIRALELVRLSHRVSYRSNRLSGGEQQRVAIARAMVNNPKILLADEPTGALDSRTSKVVMKNFCTLAHDGGIAMVIVTHDPSVAEYCDSVYTLEEGLLVCQSKKPIPPASGNSKILDSAPRLLNNVCVVDDFPVPYGTANTQTILNMHDQRILSRVYSMSGTSLASIGEGEYSLPVPIKKQGFIRTISSTIALLKSTSGKQKNILEYWHKIPKDYRFNIITATNALWAFAKSLRMTSWITTDNTKHLHALGSNKAKTATWLAAGMMGIPFSFSVHARNLINLQFNATIAKDAAFVCCDTKLTQEKLKQACQELDPNFNTTKILHIYDSPSLYPSPEDTEISPQGTTRQGEINIVMAGKITPNKGILTCIQALIELKKENQPVKLTIIGEGLFFYYLRLRTLILGLKNHIHFTGHIPHEQMMDHLLKAHIFISAGTTFKKGEQDGIPTSLTEAMLFALPIIASDLEGHLEILKHEENALIFEQNNVKSLKSAIKKFIVFPDLANEMGKNAQNLAQKLFSQENQALQISKAILEQHKAK